MELKAISLANSASGVTTGNLFCALNPATGETLDPQFNSSTVEQVDAAANSASDAFATYRSQSSRERANFLRKIADGLDAATDELATRARQETALPAPRLQGEVKRASNQFRLFAELLEEGAWIAARIDPALPRRVPLPRPRDVPRRGRGARRQRAVVERVLDRLDRGEMPSKQHGAVADDTADPVEPRGAEQDKVYQQRQNEQKNE